MQTITLPANTLNKLEKNLKETLKEISGLKKKKATKKPIRFWTKAEWEKAEREADEDIAAGRIIGPFKNARELIKELHRGVDALR